MTKPMYPIYHYMPQHFPNGEVNPEWFELRKGKITGSKAQTIGNHGTGKTFSIRKNNNKTFLKSFDTEKPAQLYAEELRKENPKHKYTVEESEKKSGLLAYIEEVVAEKHAIRENEHFINKDMARGIKYEQDAIFEYELDYGEVQSVGFVEYNEFVGVSPDGLKGDDGIIEVKCPNRVNFCGLKYYGKPIDTKYIWQMQMGMYVCQRSYADFIAYNRDYKNPLYVKRIFPDPEKFEKLKAGFEMGEKLIKEIEAKWRSCAT